MMHAKCEAKAYVHCAEHTHSKVHCYITCNKCTLYTGKSQWWSFILLTFVEDFILKYALITYSNNTYNNGTSL